MINKILTFIVNNENKFLLLKGSENDPQFHESFWYVVTGAIEEIDNTDEEAVYREVKEETGLNVVKINNLNWTFYYKSLDNDCVEKVFLSYVNSECIILNEESVDYKWCDIDEFLTLIKWYSDKKELKQILTNALTNKFLEKTKITYIK